MSRRWLPALLAVPTSFLLVQCNAPESARTDVKLPPPRLASAEFRIASSLTPAELAALIEQLFMQHPVLGQEMPCQREGPNRERVLCATRGGQASYSAQFQPDAKVLLLTAVSREYDRGRNEKPAQFERLKGQIAAMLIDRFGEANVAVK